MHPHITVATIVQDEKQRFLMVEEKDSNKNPVLNQPAGHVEPGENLLQAAIRETLEETAWKVELTQLLGIYYWISPKSNETYIRTAFIAKPMVFDKDYKIDSDITATHWLTYEEIINHTIELRTPLVVKTLEDYNNQISFPLDLVKTLIL